MRRMLIGMALVCSTLVGSFSAHAQDRPANVVVVAPSVSTRMEATRALQQLNWNEVASYRDADAVLVVVRSMLVNPMQYSYDCIKEMKHEAEMQLNISGQYVHIYIYAIDDDLAVTQLNHVHYEADG